MIIDHLIAKKSGKLNKRQIMKFRVRKRRLLSASRHKLSLRDARLSYTCGIGKRGKLKEAARQLELTRSYASTTIKPHAITLGMNFLKQWNITATRRDFAILKT